MTARRTAVLPAARAEDFIRRFNGQTVLVAGDLMLDRFIVGRVTRISPEAPVPVVRFQSEYVRLGGAANVAHNVAALGGRAHVVGVIGGDSSGERLRTELEAAGIDVSDVITDSGRRTTEKIRIVTERNQQVARIDYEDDADVSASTESEIVRRIFAAAPAAKALLVSDYLKGVITARVMDAVRSATASAERTVPVIVDPKVAHLGCYAGASVITPNLHEAETATHMRIRTDEDATDAARSFRDRSKCTAVLITRGELGMWLSTDDGEDDLAIPANTREVSDVTGAGDTVVATLALALATGATLVEAAVLANHAAGVVVAKFGPAALSAGELVDSIAAFGRQ